MLRLSRAHSEEIIAHAMEEDPYECVGVVVCQVDTRECRVVRLTNSARDPQNRFDVSPGDVRTLYKELDARREFVDVVYHSHTRVEAIPSRGDVDGADLEDAHYLIVATTGRGRALRSWRIKAGEATEEPIEFTD